MTAAAETNAEGAEVRKRLGEVLIDQGSLTQEQLEEALAQQRSTALQSRRVRLGPLLVSLGYVTDDQLARGLAAALRLPLADLANLDVSLDVVKRIPRRVAEQHLLLPIAFDNGRLTVAVADPTNVVALDDIRAYSGVTEVSLVVASERMLRDQLRRVWSVTSDDPTQIAMLHDSTDDLDGTTEYLGDADSQTVRQVNLILAEAVRARASDIHIEPQSTAVRVRFRVDGLLRDVMTARRSAGPAIVSRIKVLSNLDIAERRVPQDGRARIEVDGSAIDIRVSTLPSLLGEKVVIRLLSRADDIPSVTQLGMDDHQLETLLGTVVAPQGLVLITGPTGSGKTGTLYSTISQVKTPDRNVVTLEDPVEMQVGGITQVQVNPRAGLTFAAGLRSVLRQDPDVVLVGEVRDAETAKLALEASLTGHLVLTTLHTNSAPAAITRLIDMGVEPFLVASSLSLVVAQRLVRRVCDACAAPYRPSSRVLTTLGITEEDLAASTPRRGAGCLSCGGTGYRGRTGVFEVLPVTASLRAVLMTTPNESAVGAAARASQMQTLRASAVGKAHAGITTYEEVLRVTQVDSASGLHCTACGGALGDDMVVCPWCVTTIERGHCAGCDRALEPAWRVCPWCRHAVAEAAHDRPHSSPQEERKRPRLLVLDDDPSICSYVAMALEGVIDVVAVGTAGEALDLAGTEDFDGALIDHRLPDLTGVEVIRLLRSEPRSASLPLMMFTGDLNADVEADALAAGANDYLLKPVEPQLLEERLLALVARNAPVEAS